MVLNPHFINFAYFISRLSFFQFIIKPRKRVFVNSESDVSLFVSNLAAEKILEQKEAKLIKAALNFDEIKLKRIYLKHFLDRYPVINKKKQLVDHINKEFITARAHEKLDKVFEKLQNNYCYLAIVKSGKNILGIITLQDILNALVGKMKDEKDKIK
ncbi:1730_t:CDS:2 [Funneliformis geosporum]|uniref:1730_t:CDS:1 n=1 Tax=Funneliformis geosporum TaxID=1117311 RepID=A0A9W4SPR1_9GLOM|nr:1730_t:CDS:2 [Funneliformis geosporum]